MLHASLLCPGAFDAGLKRSSIRTTINKDGSMGIPLPEQCVQCKTSEYLHCLASFIAFALLFLDAFACMNMRYMCTQPFLAEVVLVKTCMAASSSQAAKKQKLERLEDFRRGVPFVTCSALSAILGKVEKEGVPELHGRKNLKEAVQQRLASMAGDHGPVIKNLEAVKIGGSHWNFPVLNLAGYAPGLYKQEGYWHDYFANKHMHDPSSLQSPWKGIIYADEVHPGNMLASNGRKIWCVYFSWLNLQQQGLSEEKHWFTLTVLRTEEVQKLDGGIGQVLRLILEDMFAQEFGSPLHGIVMKSSQSLFAFHWTLHLFLQDGSAQKQTFSNRQDIGSRVCMLCKNIFNVKTEQDMDDDGKISSKHLTLSSCDLASDSELLGSWDRLAGAARTANKARFAMLQQASGWTFSQQALCMSNKLRDLGLLKPASQYCFDWMHCLNSNGVLSFVICWAFESWRSKGKPDVWESSQGYLDLWQLPRANRQGSLASLFSADKIRSHRKAGHLKCTASEILGLCKPLQHFWRTCCLQPEMQDAKAALLAWLHVMELLVDAVVKPLWPGQLLASCEKAMVLTVAAGWGAVMRPKFHWTLHLESCYQRFGFLPACWSLERKHKTARKYGTASSNTVRFETSLLEEVTAEHLACLGKDGDAFSLQAQVLQPHAATAKLKRMLMQYNVMGQEDECMTSSMIRLRHGAIVKRGDMVLHAAEPGQECAYTCAKVHYCIQLHKTALVMLSAAVFLQQRWDQNMLKFREEQGDHQIYISYADDLLCSVVHNKAHDGTLTVLPPAYLRPQSHAEAKVMQHVAM